MSSDEIVVLDVIHAARLAIEFKQDMDKAEFLEDIKTQSAILHQLMVMGKRSSDCHQSIGMSIPIFPGK